MSWRRSPRPLASTLGTLQERIAPASLLAEVQRMWPQAVGAAIAAEARPIAERAGVLTVACSASVWAQELELMAPAIVGRLNELLNGGEIVRLRCLTGAQAGLT